MQVGKHKLICTNQRGEVVVFKGLLNCLSIQYSSTEWSGSSISDNRNTSLLN